MRNLKRVLSITLASVMLLGMMVLGTSAAGYDDVDDTYNVEAIEVLQAVNVMSGYAEDGLFHPDDNVNRAMMARIMAEMLNLNYDYYEVIPSKFTDVTGSYSWAKKYVDACAANGIIAGRGNGIYDPGADVTAVEAAAMMMRALGYFQYASDYEGGFEAATVRQASKINLFDKINGTAHDPMSRNQIAQLALNTLEADLVEAIDNTWHFESGDFSATSGQVIYQVRTSNSNNAGFATAINGDQAGNSADGRTGAIIQLGEQLYNGDLKLNDDTYDAFGRPARYWEYKTTPIGTYEVGATAEYTAGVKESTLYNLIGSNNFNRLQNGGTDTYFQVTVNGSPLGSPTLTNYFENNSSRNANDTGNGVLTQVYVRDKMDQTYSLRVDVAITYYWVAQVIAPYDAAKGVLKVEVKHTVNGDYASINIPNVHELTSNNFEGLDQYEEDDYIIFTYSEATNDVETIAPATLVTGTVDRYETDRSGVTLDGEPYKFNKSVSDKEYSNSSGGTGDRPMTYGLGKNATLVLDDNGYIIWVDDSTGANDYLYVYGMITNTGFKNEAQARVVFPDGTLDEITVEKLAVIYANHGTKTNDKIDNSNNPSWIDDTITVGSETAYVVDFTQLSGGNGETYGDDDNDFGALDTRYEIAGASSDLTGDQFNGWYSYTVDKGKYTLIQAETDTYVAYASLDGDGSGDTASDLKGKVVEYAGSGNGYANNNTVFLLVDGTDVTVYEGVNNLPNLNLSGDTNAYIDTMKVDDDPNKTYDSLVVIVAEDPTIDGGTESMLYIIRETGSYRDKDNPGQVIKEFAAVLDGKEITIMTRDTLFRDDTMWEKFTVDSDGYYKTVSGGGWTLAGGDKLKHVDVATVSAQNGPDLISASGEALTIRPDSGDPTQDWTYFVTKDTEVTLILVSGDPITSSHVNTMLQQGVKHEVIENIRLSTLASQDNAYINIELAACGTVTSDNGKLLDRLYVIIYGAADMP